MEHGDDWGILERLRGGVTSPEAANAAMVDALHEPSSRERRGVGRERLADLREYRRLLSRTPLDDLLSTRGIAPRCVTAVLVVEMRQTGAANDCAEAAAAGYFETLADTPAAYDESAFLCALGFLASEISSALQKKRKANRREAPEDLAGQREVLWSLIALVTRETVNILSSHEDVVAPVVEALVTTVARASLAEELAGVEQALASICTLGLSSNPEILALKCLVQVVVQADSLAKHSRASVQRIATQLFNSVPHEQSILLFQHVSVNAPDRADARTACVSLFTDLAKALPVEVFPVLRSWLARVVLHTSVNVRVFTIDSLPSIWSIASEATDRDEILKTAIGRINDKSSIARAKALAVVAQIISQLSTKLACIFLENTISAGCASPLFEAILTRIGDEKSFVRKAALELLAAILRLSRESRLGIEWKSSTVFDCVLSRTKDVISIVRKAAINVLTECLISHVPSESLSSAWLSGVLSRANDDDSKVQETCLAAFKQGVLDPLCADIESAESQRSLSILGQCTGHCIKLAQTLVAILSNRGQIGEQVVRVLQSTGERGFEAPWALLSAVATDRMKSQGVKFELYSDIVEKLSNGQLSSKFVYDLLATIARVIPSDATRAAVQSRIRGQLMDFGRVDHDVLPSIARAFVCLCDDTSDEIQSLCDACCACICRSVQTNDLGTRDAMLESAHLLSSLHTLSQLCFFTSLSFDMTFLRSLVALVAEADGRQRNANLRAFALVVLGKVCLGQSKINDRHSLEGFVRRSIPFYVKELESPLVAARGNAVLVLSDLCRRFTSLVEPYLNRLACRIQDDAIFVRRQSVLCLTSLIQEDFLKCRGGPLLFSLIRTLVDDVASVRELGKYSLTEVVLKKNCQLVPTSVVELVLCLNECTAHPQYRTSYKEIGFRKCGIDNRRTIYSVLLSTLTNEQKLVVHSKLVRDLVRLVVEEELSWDAPGTEQVLEDVLQIIGSKDMNFSSGRVHDGSGKEAGESLDSGEQQPGKNLVRAAFKLELVQSTIPLLLELKSLLENKHSPGLGRVMLCMRTLLRDFREELSELLGNNKQLISELQYDYEQEHKTEQADNRRNGANRRDVRFAAGTVQDRGAGNRAGVAFVDDDVIFESCEDVRRSAGKRRKLSSAVKERVPLGELPAVRPFELD